MRDTLYIDGKDAYLEFGAVVGQGGYHDLVTYPPLKKVEFNDWHESDGIEADLSNPTLDSRELSLTFIFRGSQYRTDALFVLLSDKAYHTFYFKNLEKTYRLRLISNTDINKRARMGNATLRFADDFPLDGYTYIAPASTVRESDDFELDGKKLSDYGIRVLEGSVKEIDKLPAVKPNLLLNIGSINGVTYDDSAVIYKSKEVKINCLLLANSLPQFWRNYDAFLCDLVRPQERILYVDETCAEYSFYYKNSSVSELSVKDRIWLKFALTLEFTSCRPNDEEFVLVSENNDIIIIPNDNAINITKYGN